MYIPPSPFLFQFQLSQKNMFFYFSFSTCFQASQANDWKKVRLAELSQRFSIQFHTPFLNRQSAWKCENFTVHNSISTDHTLSICNDLRCSVNEENSLQHPMATLSVKQKQFISKCSELNHFVDEDFDQLDESLPLLKHDLNKFNHPELDKLYSFGLIHVNITSLQKHFEYTKYTFIST